MRWSRSLRTVRWTTGPLCAARSTAARPACLQAYHYCNTTPTLLSLDIIYLLEIPLLRLMAPPLYLTHLTIQINLTSKQSYLSNDIDLELLRLA